MKKTLGTFLTLAAILTIAAAATAQKSNDAIKKQLRDLKADKAITLTYDNGAGTTKIFAKADSFSDSDAKMAGIQAMNFGMAVTYNGTAIATPNEMVPLTFWVMSKKPRFATNSKWTFGTASTDLDLGQSRYTGKPGDNMEYLNFTLKRKDLEKVVVLSGQKFRLGDYWFTFTPEQVKLLKTFLAVTDNK